MIIEPAGSQPVVSSTVPRWRLAVMGAVAALAVGIGVVLGAFLVTERSGLDGAASYVPPDAVAFMEVDLSLPGTQRQHLRALLERFPGADADLLLTDELAGALDDVLAKSQTPVDYSTNIAPWFTGSMSLALFDYQLGAGADPASGLVAGRVPAMAAFFGSRDPVAAAAVAETLRDEMTSTSGMGFSSSEHAGVTIWSLEIDPSASEQIENAEFAYAVTDDQLILATGADEVTTALDTHGGNSSLATRSELQDLSSRLPAERVGFMAFDVKAMYAGMRDSLSSAAPEMMQAFDEIAATLPGLSVAAVGFEDDAFHIDAATPNVAEPLTVENTARTLAERVPGDALFYADGSNLGAALSSSIRSMKVAIGAAPGSTDALAQLDQVESALGTELEEYFSWIGNGAAVAGWDGTQPYFGLLLQADDPEAASQRLDQLRSLLQLAIRTNPSGITVEQRDVGGVEVTAIRVDPAGSAGSWGMLGGSEAIVEYALDGDTVLLGAGDTFVEASLNVDPAQSLAANERYTRAVQRFGGTDNASVLFLDLAGIREAVLAAVPADALADPAATPVIANLEPLDYVVMVAREDGGLVVTRFGLVVE